MATSFGTSHAAPVAVGQTFRVNTYTSGVQEMPVVLEPAEGGYVVIWRSVGQDGDAGGIYARVVADDGAEIVPEFRVNTTTEGDQRDPSAARAPGGGFAVVWTSSDDTTSQLLARLYAADAQPRTDELVLADDVGPGTVGVDASGNLSVAYRTADLAIVVARFDPDGTTIGEPTTVTEAGEDTLRPAVSALPSGEFVVAWHDETYRDPDEAFPYYSRNSAVLVAPFASSASVLPAQYFHRGNENSQPHVAAGDTGFVVAWSSCYSEPGEYQARPCDRTHVAVQSLGADGSTDGSSVVVSGVEPGYQRIGPLDAAVHDSGRFTVVWSGPTVGGDARGLVARQFTPELRGSGGALLVDESEFAPLGGAAGLGVAAGPDDSSIVVWQQDDDVFAARVGRFEICKETDECRPARPGRGRLRMRSASLERPARVRFVWVGRASARTCLADDGIAPTASFFMKVIHGGPGSGPLFLLDAPVCGAPPCWRFGEAGNVVYEDPTGSQNGVIRARFRVRPRGRALLIVRAAGPNVPTFELPVPLPIGVLFVGGPEGTTENSFCAYATFDQAEVNDPNELLADGAATP